MVSWSPKRCAIAFGLAMLAAAWLATPPRGMTQEPAPREKEPKGKWFPVFQRHSGEYAVRVGADAKEEARMVAEPLLRWSQPIRGGDDGAIYLWTRRGRPVAVVSFFTYKWPTGLRVILHERHSLTTEPVEATWRQAVVWKTSRPGLAFSPVPKAPVPAGTAPARLRQMQALVRAFSANTVDDKSTTWPLRPLVKPLYRYDSKGDGAVFAMVQGTDPEAFLVFEARGEGKDARWEFAVARFTDLEIHVRLDGREVFSGPRTLGAADAIYQSLDAVQKRSDSPKDFD